MTPIVIAAASPTDDAQASIGSATMDPDGTIVLRLRAQGFGGVIGDGVLRYAPTSQGYQAVRNHLPSLRPGQTVPVPPFP